MKKYLVLITLIFGSVYSYGQDFKNVNLFIGLNQFDKAKAEIDSYLSNEKNAAKADGWYYKAFVYNALGRTDTKSSAERKSFLQAGFDALKKYKELDPKQPLTTEETNNTMFNTYYGFDDLGIKTYNDKNFEESYAAFNKALEIHDYIYSNNITGNKGFKLSELDTNMVWNLSVLANELKKKDDVIGYYKKLADANLKDEKYIVVYDELVLKYKREKNVELFNKYLTSAKNFYPADKAYWENLDIDFSVKELEGDALFAKYDELTTRYPGNYMVVYNHGIELDKYIFSDDGKGKDMSAYKKKREEIFKNAIAIKSTIEANLQLTNLYYNSSFDYLDEIGKIKGTKPEDVKKKNDLLALSKESMNKAVPYGEEAVRLLGELKEYKITDKANYKLALEILSTVYKKNGNTVKADEYEKKKADVDKL